ncbi:peptidylprolyl isomerase, partial [Pseudomonas aeruginosa]
PGQMVRSIDNAIFRKPVGVLQGPLKSQFGYHLLEVYFRD